MRQVENADDTDRFKWPVSGLKRLKKSGQLVQFSQCFRHNVDGQVENADPTSQNDWSMVNVSDLVIISRWKHWPTFQFFFCISECHAWIIAIFGVWLVWGGGRGTTRKMLNSDIQNKNVIGCSPSWIINIFDLRIVCSPSSASYQEIHDIVPGMKLKRESKQEKKTSKGFVGPQSLMLMFTSRFRCVVLSGGGSQANFAFCAISL